MTDPEKSAAQTTRTAAQKAEREARLAKALRDNLRRRKQPAAVSKPDPEA
jgi:hypothetical protein